jgi:hypothetical protein
MNIMKKLTYKFLVAAGLLAFTFVACKKNELRLTQYDLPGDKAYVRFALLSPGTPSSIIRVNDQKINGANTSGALGFYPSIVNNADYTAVAPNGTVKLSLANSGTGNDSVVLFTGMLPLQSGKFYSVALADTGVDRTLIAIEDVMGPAPDSGFIMVRLFNAMAKTEPLTLIRIDSANATTVIRDTIARNIAYKTASEFIRIRPTGVNAFQRLRLVTASGMPVGAQTPPTGSQPNRRYMTIFAYGFGNGTGVFAPGISTFIYNQ